VSERVGVTPINTGSARENGVGVRVGVGVSVGVSVGLGVKVAVGSKVGVGVRAGVGVGVAGCRVGDGMVGTNVGSAKMDAGLPVISNILSIVPQAMNARIRVICLPRVIYCQVWKVQD